jgi:hypothetical protein
MVALRKGKIMSESNLTFDFSSVHPVTAMPGLASGSGIF